MSEVEKMYENAGVEPKKECYYWDCPYSTGMPANDIPYVERNCQNCNNPNKAVYPPFTAEKQIELIKWLMHKKQTIQIELRLHENDYCISHITECEDNDAVEYVETGRKNTFDEALADLVNELWQDLTDAEKTEIKNILESEVRE